MWFKTVFILISVSILTCDVAFAQLTPAKTDSTKLYENIETYSKKSKFTKLIHGLVFKPVANSSKKRKVYKKLIQKPYSTFEGKIIRHINIVTLDPFGYSITDTNVASQNFFLRSGNTLHVQSRSSTIRNLLLIRQNQPFDSLLVKESERLVRSQGYVHDVSFFVRATSENSDSVDIFIRELDKWSLIPKVAASSTRITIDLTERDFLGLGHEFNNIYTWNHSTGDHAYITNYFIPNIRNTHITATVNYGIDELKNNTKSLSVDRPFFSPFTKWAAGVYFIQQFHRDSIHISDSLLVLQRFKFNAQDYWAGYSFQVFKGNTETYRTTNFISTVRFARIRYLERPVEMYDTLHEYSNDDFYLASIGISRRKYVQDKFIFRYGITEDIPIGKVYSLTGGYQKKDNTDRFYLGLRFSSGNYFSWGYLSSNFEYGTFFHGSPLENGIFKAGINYFTGLFEIGKWKFRQFVKAQVAIGINRFPYESINLNDGYGLDGFNSSTLTGKSRLFLKLQTQSYAPWNFIGFRFGPFLVCSFGMLGDAATGFKNSRIYSQLGLGILIRNEYLVINNFQISIAFYPLIPGIGQDVFKMNSFKTTDFGLRDFEIGKPEIVNYQ